MQKIKGKMRMTAMQAGLLLTILAHLAGLGLYLADSKMAEKNICLERPEPGQGEREEQFTASLQGKESPVIIRIKEKVYTEKEAGKIFEKVKASMEEKIKGKNKNLDRIEYPLSLLEQSGEYPVSLFWTSDAPEVLDGEGKIGEHLPSGGSPATLICMMELGEHRSVWERKVQVFPEKLSPEKRIQKEIQEKVDKENPAEEGKIRLPERIFGEKVIFRRETEQRGLTLAVFGTILGCSLPLLEKEKKKQKKQARENELREEYPELINRILLLLQAGLTVRGALERIAGDYSLTQKAGVERKRAVYEEVLQTCREMTGGQSESRAYERFGQRCGISEYKVLSVLLIQNLKKGNPEVLDLLEREACMALEEQKRKVKIGGEQAETKLLGPMLIQLCIVIAVIVIPVFFNFYQ